MNHIPFTPPAPMFQWVQIVGGRVAEVTTGATEPDATEVGA